ncbi:hypothetical protein K438DRAFT_1747239 [Mycena galopus ATCC 62051]|nr:hypothetical protein K438DRAFT_1747239 [Mycena galopus ATCC 62051]
MDTFNEIHAQLSKIPGLCESIGMEKAMQFVRIASRLKDSITVAQPPRHDATEPPELIPDEIHKFLAGATEMPADFVDGCWKAFRSLIWAYDENGKTKGADAEAFKKHGLDHLLSSRMLFPPTYYCTTPGCVNTGLLRDKDAASNVVLYTLSDGACPTFAHHLSCSGTGYLFILEVAQSDICLFPRLQSTVLP